jgi:hypothetical protein
MRLSVFLALLIVGRIAMAAGDGQFSGVWIAWICPAGVQYDPVKCSNLVLELQQKQDKLCGAHVFATAGARQLDEGAAPSLTGSVSNGVAVVSVESGRASPPLKIQVEMKMVRGSLQWRRLENPEGDYLLPLSAQLSKSKYGSLFHPVFEQKLQASCVSILNMAADPAASAAARSPPQSAGQGSAPESR